MENFPLKTKFFLISLMLSGLILMVWNLQFLQREDLWLLLVLMVLGSLAVIFRIEGTTIRSHYTISFIVYSFTLFQIGDRRGDPGDCRLLTWQNGCIAKGNGISAPSMSAVISFVFKLLRWYLTGSIPVAKRKAGKASLPSFFRWLRSPC